LQDNRNRSLLLNTFITLGLIWTLCQDFMPNQHYYIHYDLQFQFPICPENKT
jgi:hypothetical protein